MRDLTINDIKEEGRDVKMEPEIEEELDKLYLEVYLKKVSEDKK